MKQTSAAIHQSDASKLEVSLLQQADLLKDMKKLSAKVSVLQAEKMAKSLPKTFLNEASVKSFDEHLRERGRTFEQHQDEIAMKMDAGGHPNSVAYEAMSKTLADSNVKEKSLKLLRSAPEFKNLRKSMINGTTSDVKKAESEFTAMAKSVLGGPNSGGEAGSSQAFLQENLSDIVLKIILNSADAQMTQSISTAITSSINPEVPVLESTGSGYGKGTLGFLEGATPIFGGGSIKTRIAKTLVQRGVKASVTEMLKANRGKLAGFDPLMAEREERMIERNLMINHLLIYGDDQINKNGTEIQEMSGFVQQLENSAYAGSNIRDFNGVALTEPNGAIDMFREAAEQLIKIGLLQGGTITGKYTVLMDYGVANQLSKIIDDKQRVLIGDIKQLATQYGQQFTGINTDLGIFRFKRTRTLELVQNNTWTATAKVSQHAITWPGSLTTAVAQAANGTVVPKDGIKALPVGTYHYRVSVVNDHGESDISAAFNNAVAVAANQEMLVTLADDAAFAGGTVGGFVVSPARYFILYRGIAGAGDVQANMYPIAKIPYTGGATTFDDFDQKVAGTTDILFISNDPMDIAHTSLIPPKEIPIYDPSLATSTIWSIYDIANLTMWAPQRQFLWKNVPGGVAV